MWSELRPLYPGQLLSQYEQSVSRNLLGTNKVGRSPFHIGCGSLLAWPVVSTQPSARLQRNDPSRYGKIMLIISLHNGITL